MNQSSEPREIYRSGCHRTICQSSQMVAGALLWAAAAAYAAPEVQTQGVIPPHAAATVPPLSKDGETGTGGIYLLAQLEAPSEMPTKAAILPKRTYLQWNGMKDQRLQIYIDSGQKKAARYHGATPDLAADLLLQMPGDGSVEVMRYTGSGTDWKWDTIEAHAVLLHPDQDTFLVEFDADTVASSSAIKIQFRFLDKSWNATSASKVLTWRPVISSPI